MFAYHVCVGELLLSRNDEINVFAKTTPTPWTNDTDDTDDDDDDDDNVAKMFLWVSSVCECVCVRLFDERM